MVHCRYYLQCGRNFPPKKEQQRVQHEKVCFGNPRNYKFTTTSTPVALSNEGLKRKQEVSSGVETCFKKQDLDKGFAHLVSSQPPPKDTRPVKDDSDQSMMSEVKPLSPHRHQNNAISIVDNKKRVPLQTIYSKFSKPNPLFPTSSSSSSCKFDKINNPKSQVQACNQSPTVRKPVIENITPEDEPIWSNDDDVNEARKEFIWFLKLGVEDDDAYKLLAKQASVNRKVVYKMGMGYFLEQERITLWKNLISCWERKIVISPEKQASIKRRKELMVKFGRTFTDVPEIREKREKLLCFLEERRESDEELKIHLAAVNCTMKNISFFNHLGYTVVTKVQRLTLLTCLRCNWLKYKDEESVARRTTWAHSENGRLSKEKSKDTEKLQPRLNLMYFGNICEKFPELLSLTLEDLALQFAKLKIPQSIYPGRTKSTTGRFGIRFGHYSFDKNAVKQSPIYLGLVGKHESMISFQMRVVLCRSKRDTQYGEAFILRFCEEWNKTWGSHPTQFLLSNPETDLDKQHIELAKKYARNKQPLFRFAKEEEPSHPPAWATVDQLLQLPYTIKASDLRQRTIFAESGIRNEYQHFQTIEELDIAFPGRPADVHVIADDDSDDFHSDSDGE